MSARAHDGAWPARLRVLHLLSGQEKGGIARVVAAVSTGARLEGAEVIVGTLGKSGAPVPDGVRVVRFGRRGPFDLRAAGRLIAFARRERITIVHTHNVTANLYGLLLILMVPQLVHVIHVHAHFQQILLESQRSRLKRFLLLRGNAWALRRCDRVIANSESVRDFLLEHAVDPGKIRVVYNGVDVLRIEEDARLPCPLAESFSGQSTGGDSGTKLVGAFGRLAPVKNYPLLLEAARLVLEKEPARFVIAGEGPERGELERLASQLGIADRVHFAGWLQNPYPFLAVVDVVVLTSSAEGFGLALLEAMALERPVVATAVGAIPEIVHDGMNGILVPAADPEALASAIVRLLRDRSLRGVLGARGHEVALREFSSATMCDRVEQVYLSAMEHRRFGRTPAVPA